jgi:hypothetical protein
MQRRCGAHSSFAETAPHVDATRYRLQRCICMMSSIHGLTDRAVLCLHTAACSVWPGCCALVAVTRPPASTGTVSDCVREASHLVLLRNVLLLGQSNLALQDVPASAPQCTDVLGCVQQLGLRQLYAVSPPLVWPLESSMWRVLCVAKLGQLRKLQPEILSVSLLAWLRPVAIWVTVCLSCAAVGCSSLPYT